MSFVLKVLVTFSSLLPPSISEWNLDGLISFYSGLLFSIILQVLVSWEGLWLLSPLLPLLGKKNFLPLRTIATTIPIYLIKAHLSQCEAFCCSTWNASEMLYPIAPLEARVRFLPGSRWFYVFLLWLYKVDRVKKESGTIKIVFW